MNLPTPEDVRQIAEVIWETTLALPITDDPTSAGATSPRSVAACVQIGGAWTGAVILSCPEAIARHAAAAMFACADSCVTAADMQDAVAELANMLAGHLKGLVSENCSLSLPTVIDGGDYTARIPGARLLHRSCLSCNGSQVAISVLELAASTRRAA